jgi:hypothetical protein
MNVTRNVILDLLPLYFAGEVSADTKALVDEFLQTDPDFARMSQRFDSIVKLRGARPADDTGERRALQQTRALLRYRNQSIGLAVGYSLAPFAFVFRNQRIEWILFQEKPAIAIAFAATAVACWIAAYVIGRRVRRFSHA